MRVRLKADGRLVEIAANGNERAIAADLVPVPRGENHADYAKRVRSATYLTQAEFAERIGVPVDTVRNWEQGKRAPRGPARALLKLLDQAPDVAFSVLGRKST